MNTPNDDGGRALAVQHAEHGTDAWRSVVHAQRSAPADHVDFYGLGSEVVETLWCLSSLADLLVIQVATYGRGRTLRDDEVGHDPAERLAIASSWAAQLQQDVDRAGRSANRFWSEVGHIAIEDPS